MKTYGHFIHGREAPAANGETFPSYAPMTGEILGYAARGTEADVEAAVTSARQGYLHWSSLFLQKQRKNIYLTLLHNNN